METKNATPTLISLLNSFIGALTAKYPGRTLNLSFGEEVPLKGMALLNPKLWESPDGKLYLWAMPDSDTQITFTPTDLPEIEECGVCTTELNTHEGLTLVIAEDF